MEYKHMNLNAEALKTYSDEQLAAWGKDNGLTDEEVKEVKEKLNPAPVVEAAAKEQPSTGKAVKAPAQEK
jgi:hypothetical protein